MSTPIKTMTGQEIKILRSWLHRPPPPVFDDEHEDEDYGYEYFANPYLGTSKKGKKTT